MKVRRMFSRGSHRTPSPRWAFVVPGLAVMLVGLVVPSMTAQAAGGHAAKGIRVG